MDRICCCVGVRLGNFTARLMVAFGLAGFLAGIIFGFTRLPSLLMWGVPSALLVAGLVFSERNGHISTANKEMLVFGR